MSSRSFSSAGRRFALLLVIATMAVACSPVDGAVTADRVILEADASVPAARAGFVSPVPSPASGDATTPPPADGAANAPGATPLASPLASVAPSADPPKAAAGTARRACRRRRLGHS